MAEPGGKMLLEPDKSSESDLTDLSSEGELQDGGRGYSYSSASIFGSESPKQKKSTDRKTTSKEDVRFIDKEALRRDAVRISLTRRKPLKLTTAAVGIEKLQQYLQDTYNDLDRLIQYTYVVTEENTSLREILRGAVIPHGDDEAEDYSEVLLSTDHNLPIINNLNERQTLPQTGSDQLEEDGDKTPMPTEGPKRFSWSKLPEQTQSGKKMDTPEPCQDEQGKQFRRRDTPRPTHDNTGRKFSWSNETEEPPSYDATDPPSPVNISEVFTLSMEREVERKLTGSDDLSGSNDTMRSRFSTYSTSLPHAIIEENTTHAVGTGTDESNLDHSRDERASVSIRKLLSLTFTDSSLQSDSSRVEQPKTTRKTTRIRKTQGLRRAKTNQFPRAVRPTADDPEEDDNPMKQPKFFTSDMLSIITERNELKEKVHQLEEKVNQLERRLEEAETAANAEEDTVDNPPQRANSFFRKNTRVRTKLATTESERFISDVLVIGYKKKEGSFVYVIHTTWSDGQRFEIYRRYGAFFTFNDRLQQLFPAEAGKLKSTERTLPTLPAIDNVLSLFGRTNNEKVLIQRLGTINEYCQILLRELEPSISRNEYVVSFFRPQVGDTQLQKLALPRTASEIDLSILSVYPQQIPAGSTFEEYIVLADYKSTAEGELTVDAGQTVKVISREATGWWMVSKTDEGDQEEVGYVPGDFLKRYDPAQTSIDEDSVAIRQKYLGFVSSAALNKETDEEIDIALMYVAIEDYHSEDPRQLSFAEGDQLIVVEKSEDGWWLVAMEGKQGWAPASFMEPMDRRSYPEGENLLVSMAVPEGAMSAPLEKYVTKAAFKGQCEDDISFPEKATIEVIEKSISGWWMVRYKGKIGMAPASMLAITDAQLDVPNEYKFALTVNLGHGVSGIIQAPPRSKKFLLASATVRRERSNTNTEERKFETVLEEGHLEVSDQDSDEDSEQDTLGQHVRKHVITHDDQGRKQQLMKFKSFVRPKKLKQAERRLSGTFKHDKKDQDRMKRASMPMDGEIPMEMFQHDSDN